MIKKRKYIISGQREKELYSLEEFGTKASKSIQMSGDIFLFAIRNSGLLVVTETECKCQLLPLQSIDQF